MNKEVNIVEAENVRDIEIVTNEIKTLVSQAHWVMTKYIIEIGRRLVEAKSLLPHGEWGNWLREKVGFSQSSANNYMKIFEEYGDEQITLFGAVPNSQTLGNLPYTKALKLLALPDEEREEFAKENNIDDMSSRELEQAIREKNEAKVAAEKAEREKAELERLLEESRACQTQAEETEVEMQELKEDIRKLQAEIEKAKLAEKKAKERLKRLKENPEIPDTVTEMITAEAEAAAAEKHKKELDDILSQADEKIADALKKKKAAEDSAVEAKKQYEELLKKQKMNDPDVMEFKVYFSQAQDVQKILIILLERIREKDPETAKGLGTALVAIGRKYIQCEENVI